MENQKGFKCHHCPEIVPSVSGCTDCVWKEVEEFQSDIRIPVNEERLPPETSAQEAKEAQTVKDSALSSDDDLAQRLDEQN